MSFNKKSNNISVYELEGPLQFSASCSFTRAKVLFKQDFRFGHTHVQKTFGKQNFVKQANFFSLDRKKHTTLLLLVKTEHIKT